MRPSSRGGRDSRGIERKRHSTILACQSFTRAYQTMSASDSPTFTLQNDRRCNRIPLRVCRRQPCRQDPAQDTLTRQVRRKFVSTRGNRDGWTRYHLAPGTWRFRRPVRWRLGDRQRCQSAMICHRCICCLTFQFVRITLDRQPASFVVETSVLMPALSAASRQTYVIAITCSTN